MCILLYLKQYMNWYAFLITECSFMFCLLWLKDEVGVGGGCLTDV